MTWEIDQVLIIIVVLTCILVLVTLTTGSLGKSTDSIFEKTDQATLCNAWIMNGCKIIDPIYLSNLSDATICDTCPLPTNSASLDLTELEVALKIECSGDDGEWTICRNTCSCPPDNTYLKGCGAKKCDSFGNDCSSGKMCFCRTTGCECVDSDYCANGNILW